MQAYVITETDVASMVGRLRFDFHTGPVLAVSGRLPDRRRGTRGMPVVLADGPRMEPRAARPIIAVDDGTCARSRARLFSSHGPRRRPPEVHAHFVRIDPGRLPAGPHLLQPDRCAALPHKGGTGGELRVCVGARRSDLHDGLSILMTSLVAVARGSSAGCYSRRRAGVACSLLFIQSIYTHTNHPGQTTRQTTAPAAARSRVSSQ